MLKIAHRGYSKHYKENTLCAFNEAVNHKFDMIELDIQLDKNNQIIIMHDTHIDYIPVKTMKYSDMIKHNPDLLLLSTFFQKFKYTDIKLYFDLKGCDKLAEILHNFLVKYNINTENIWFASFNINHLDILYTENKEYKLGLITDNNFTLDIITYIISKYNIQFVCFQWSMLNKQCVNMLKYKQVMVFVYTLENENLLPLLNKYHINGIVTDILYN